MRVLRVFWAPLELSETISEWFGAPDISKSRGFGPPGVSLKPLLLDMSGALNHSEIVSETSSGAQKTRKTLNFQMLLKKINFTEGIKKNL